MSYDSLQNRKVSIYTISSTVSSGMSVFNTTAVVTDFPCAIRPIGARESYIIENVELDIRASHIMYAHDNSSLDVGNGIKITAKKDRSGIWSSVSAGSEFIILTKIENADSRDDRVVMQIGPLTTRTVNG